ESWSTSHIWLHKQPLFLWQIASCFKLFGVNELTLRLPNIIAHGFMAIMLYDIGKIVKSELTGLLLAIVFCYMRFPLMYAAGMEATDHNDYMFLFYVTASFWAIFKYMDAKKKMHLIFIGVFVGCAVLVKWLTGFLVIGVWVSYLLLFERKNFIKPLFAFVIAFLICMPWQLYCYFKYKVAFINEMTFNNQHLTHALEGHSGPWYYHFKELQNLYANDFTVFLILTCGIIFFAVNKVIPLFYRYIVLSAIFFVYAFFSIVETKMPAFCIIVIPLVLLCIVSSIEEVASKIKQFKIRRLLYFVFIPLLTSYFMNPDYFIKRHTLNFRPNEHFAYKDLYEKTVIKELGKQFPAKKIVFINAQGLAVKLMFYLDCDATDQILSKEVIDKLKSDNYTLAAFNIGLPQYIIKDEGIIKL
ncbi:MAG: hypothetical protein JWO32_830, partial [Bacteroidetes bacterium]|nr:hypothetical protein [Bacteroidota bacterium]